MRRFLALTCVLACKPDGGPEQPAPVRDVEAASPSARLQVNPAAVCVDEGDAVRCWGDRAADYTVRLEPGRERIFFGCTRERDGNMRCPQRGWSEVPLPDFARGAVTAGDHCLVDRDGRHACLDLHARTWHTPLRDVAARSAAGRADAGCLIDQVGSLACWRRAEAVYPLDRRARLRRLADGSSSWRGCAITETDDVVCWRHDGTDLERPDVGRFGAAVDVSFAYGHACARLADGRVACFGANCSGQLGTGDRRARDTAELVPGLSDVDEVRAGERATCARTGDGSLWCWGRAEVFGGARPGPRARPEPVFGLDDAVALAVAAHQSCAVTASGFVMCWGRWYDGAVSPTPECLSYAPERRDYQGFAVAVALGEDLGCARDRDGRASCWRPYTAFASTAAAVELPGVTSDMSIGTGHVCAIQERGAVRCWSFDDDDDEPTLGPGRPIALPGPAVQIDAADDRACAVTRAGTAHCWRLSGAPVKLETLPWRDGADIALGVGVTCVRTRTSRVRCLGVTAEQSQRLAELTDVRAVAVAPAGVCALTGDGAIRCVGRLELFGAAADGSVGAATIAADVPARDFGLGEGHGCALGSDARVRCWGRQVEQGQLGDGLMPFVTAPVRVHGPTRARP